MYEKEFDIILNASRNKTLTFFVGAGVSRASGAPIWNELTNAICRKINLGEKGEYSYEENLRIPQMYFASLKDNEKYKYYQTVEDAINKKDLLPNDVHRAMLSLNPVSFITTNYDTLIEDSAVKYGQVFKTIACDHDVPIIQGDRFILKMHGDFKNQNFVLKEEDYLNYSDDFKLIDTLLKSIFATNTVVFIGYKLSDYNIKLILNWAKELLDNDFREPIFLHTDDDELTQLDLDYYKSKKISVIEWQKVDKDNNGFPGRYLSFFEAVGKKDINVLEGKGDDELLEVLYSRLEPLDRLHGLRLEDLSKKIASNNLVIEGSGVIRVLDNNNLFKRFIEIEELNEEEKSILDKRTLQMSETIKRILGKACVYWIVGDKKYYRIKHLALSFADENCIMFDYKSMNSFVTKTYDSLDDNLTKAYYLYKMSRYNEALQLSLEIARVAFREQNYLAFYFAKSNCYILGKIIKNDGEIDDLLGVNHIEKLFEQLPVDFKYNYESLKDIHSPALLYRYAYNAFESAHKVDEVINTYTIEYGSSSSDRAIGKINDYMHFFQANRLMSDAFAEYKNSVKRIMEALVHKYAIQDKEEISINRIMPRQQDKIIFDEIDFNCFVDLFKASELVRLFDRNSITTIAFKDGNKIETSVRNLIEYYRTILREKRGFVELEEAQSKIKNALVVLHYMDLSQNFVDYTCSFIISNEFRDIKINDKILFLDRQVYRRKKQSLKIIKIIEKRLLLYIDEHKKSIEDGTSFNVFSSATNISYHNLANYLAMEDDNYISRGLSKRIDALIESNQIELFSPYYFAHITKKEQRKLRTWIEKRVESKMDIKLLSTLFDCHYTIGGSVNKKLIEFIREDIKEGGKTSNVIVFPQKKKYENLIQVGYWCFLGLLNPDDYKEFAGISDEYDFYYLYDRFDFDKFDVRWLINLYDEVLKRIAKNEKVVTAIRKAIVNSIELNAFSDRDSERLQRILMKHFC